MDPLKGIVLRKMHFFFLSFLDSRGLMLSFEQKKFWGPYAKWCPRGGGQRGDLQAKKMKKSYRGKICMDFDQTFTGHTLGVPSPYHSLFWTLNQN